MSIFVHMDKVKATDRVKALIVAGRSTKVDLSQKLGITRVTLDTRLKKSNWRKGELAIINQL